MTSFIAYLKNHVAHQSFFIFASTTVYAYPAVDYTDAVAPSRFAFPGWVPGMLRRHDAQADADKIFFTNMMIEDFVTQKRILFLSMCKHIKIISTM